MPRVTGVATAALRRTSDPAVQSSLIRLPVRNKRQVSVRPIANLNNKLAHTAR
jgi:hypothetical protein